MRPYSFLALLAAIMFGTSTMHAQIAEIAGPPVQPCKVAELAFCPVPVIVEPDCWDNSCELLTQDPHSVLTEENWNELNPVPVGLCNVNSIRTFTFAAYGKFRPWSDGLDRNAAGKIIRFGLRNWDSERVECFFYSGCGCEDGFDPLVGADCIYTGDEPEAPREVNSAVEPIAPLVCPELG